MGTITTYSYCVVKDGKAFEGSKEDIINQIFTWGFEKNQLFAKCKGFKEALYHSYKEDWMAGERYKDAIQFLFGKLKDFGYKNYRDIGF